MWCSNRVHSASIAQHDEFSQEGHKDASASRSVSKKLLSRIPPLRSHARIRPLVSNVPLVQVDISLLADDVRVAATHTLDFGQGVHDLPLAVNVSVEQTVMVSILSHTVRFGARIHTEGCERTAAKGQAARETW